VIDVVRASSRSFEVHRNERTYQNGKIAKSEVYTSTVETILTAGAADPLKNPLGLFVDAFRWKRDDTN
jgi:type IV secretory pathway TrbF-like protein